MFLYMYKQSKGPEVALDEHLRAIFPSVGSGPALEEGGEATLLGIQNLQSHLDKQIELVRLFFLYLGFFSLIVRVFTNTAMSFVIY